MSDHDSAIAFNTFDKNLEHTIRERNLPHWFQPGVAVFLTFRTLDSLPRKALIRIQHEMVSWLRGQGIRMDNGEPSRFVPLSKIRERVGAIPTRVQREYLRRFRQLIHQTLDECHGECHLRDPKIASIVAEAILHGHQQKFDLDRFVIMPNHVHAIVQFRTGYDLRVVGQSWMRYSARRINQFLGRSGGFWQPEPFDHLIRSAEQLTYLQSYIDLNPERANLRSGEFFQWSDKRRRGC